MNLTPELFASVVGERILVLRGHAVLMVHEGDTVGAGRVMGRITELLQLATYLQLSIPIKVLNGRPIDTAGLADDYPNLPAGTRL